MQREQARTAVAQAARRLAAEGLLIGTAGNVGVALSGADAGLIAVTGTGVVLAEAGADAVTVVDAHGTVVDGALAPTSELDLHLDLLARPDVGAVVHTHAPVSTALSLVLDELPCVHYQQLLLGGSTPVVPFAVFGSAELADSVHVALRDRHAVLLANHGTVTIGPDLDTAVERALLLEWACTLYWQAAALGTPRALTQADQEAVIEAALRTGYGSTRPAAGDRP
ncbi:class II aldolase/adducin family protein [Nocardioides ferulae]|uniref:class II aldolase/adducin family protein n=1 Tax=Nocardioides ferulae TaxID=2340821 RepID=UPI000EAF4695|nr:class II aldolase/adducin family protein [Nocardioides ferulae]